MVGAGGYALTPAQAQQVALARLVLADPHTLVLDEATSLLDPSAARHLERSLASVLRGRTVVAIAHRLHTAHDADRVAVVEEGRLQEVGTHDELVRNGSSYAALWDSWHGDRLGTPNRNVRRALDVARRPVHIDPHDQAQAHRAPRLRRDRRRDRAPRSDAQLLRLGDLRHVFPVLLVVVLAIFWYRDSGDVQRFEEHR